ncbi:hypothetical protein Bbelb_367370 [Branchiostoma belcheri]|nr:hypothetical protein Bbelb_367370 [Branchiostoma belcheri]
MCQCSASGVRRCATGLPFPRVVQEVGGRGDPLFIVMEGFGSGVGFAEHQAPKMAAAFPTPTRRIHELLQLPESATFSELYGSYASFIQEYTKELEAAKKLKPAERRTFIFEKSGEEFKEVSSAFLSHFEPHADKTTDCLRSLAW